MGKLTDEGLKSIPKFCMNLEHLALSLLSEITGATLIPLFKDTSRAMKFRKLNLSFRKVRLFIVPVHHQELRLCNAEIFVDLHTYTSAH